MGNCVTVIQAIKADTSKTGTADAVGWVLIRTAAIREEQGQRPGLVSGKGKGNGSFGSVFRLWSFQVFSHATARATAGAKARATATA